MAGFLKRIFGGAATAAKEHAAVHHDGFDIIPRPRKRDGGWSTEATIRKQVGDEIREHNFIRADAAPSETEAIALTVRKAKTLIDQQGERIFK